MGKEGETPDPLPDLAARLRAEDLDLSSWSNGPGDRYGAHDHAYDKVIVVERGSIEFGLPAARSFGALVAGDRLELPAGTRHDAVVGPEGVACLEAHLPAGRLTAVARRPAGDW
jgi:quercetin dioxygenase-like cupin family protein